MPSSPRVQKTKTSSRRARATAQGFHALVAVRLQAHRPKLTNVLPAVGQNKYGGTPLGAVAQFQSDRFRDYAAILFGHLIENDPGVNLSECGLQSILDGFFQ